VLVSFPLLLQLALLATVANLQNQAESEARRAEISRQIADEVIAITRDMVSLKTNLEDAPLIASEAAPTSQYQILNDDIERHFLKLRELTRDKPVLAQAVEKSFATMHRSRQLVDDTRVAYQAGKLRGRIDRFQFVFVSKWLN